MDARGDRDRAAARRVEIVRGIYERWAEGDFSAGPDVFDEQVIFILRPEFPDSGTYVGREQVAEYMRGFLEPWDRMTIAAEEMIEAGDSVVVAVRQQGVGSSSGADTGFNYFQVWTFRGDSAVRFESVRDRADALALVGLSEG